MYSLVQNCVHRVVHCVTSRDFMGQLFGAVGNRKIRQKWLRRKFLSLRSSVKHQ